jgi:hypothetical protein
MVTERRECEVMKVGETVRVAARSSHNCHTRYESDYYKRVHDTRVLETISSVSPSCTMHNELTMGSVDSSSRSQARRVALGLIYGSVTRACEVAPRRPTMKRSHGGRHPAVCRMLPCNSGSLTSPRGLSNATFHRYRM